MSARISLILVAFASTSSAQPAQPVMRVRLLQEHVRANFSDPAQEARVAFELVRASGVDLVAMYHDREQCHADYLAHKAPKLVTRAGKTPDSWLWSEDGGAHWQVVFTNARKGVLYCPHVVVDKPDAAPAARDVALDVLSAATGATATTWKHPVGCASHGTSLLADEPDEVPSALGWVCQQPTVDADVGIAAVHYLTQQLTSLSEQDPSIACVRAIAHAVPAVRTELVHELGQPGQPGKRSQARERVALMLAGVAGRDVEAPALAALATVKLDAKDVQTCRDQGTIVQLLATIVVANKVARTDTMSALRVIARDPGPCGEWDHSFFARRNALTALLAIGDPLAKKLATSLAATCDANRAASEKASVHVSKFEDNDDELVGLDCFARAALAP